MPRTNVMSELDLFAVKKTTRIGSSQIDPDSSTSLFQIDVLRERSIMIMMGIRKKHLMNAKAQ